MGKIFRDFRQFFLRYTVLSFVIIFFLTGAILALMGLHTAAHWALSGAAAISVLCLAWRMTEDVRSGAYGVDILAITGMVTSIALKEYWTAAVIALVSGLSEVFKDYAQRRAKMELAALLAQKPLEARLLKGQKVVDVAAEDVRSGDKTIIMTGEIVPVDSIILDGSTKVDEFRLTGEASAQSKKVDDEILAGSINLGSAITARALRSEAESQYEQIVKMVKSASVSRSPLMKLTEKYSIPFTAVSFMVAGAAWSVSGQADHFLRVIVVATPCSLLLGAPIAIVSGINRAAKKGIIFRAGAALERLAESQTIAFAQTGVLTIGKPTVSGIKAFGKFNEEKVLGYAASLEKVSSHVIAKAIVKYAEKKGLKPHKIKQVKEVIGSGLTGRIDGKTVLIGRLNFVQEAGVILSENLDVAALKHSAVFVAVNDELIGVISLRDEIRPEASKTLTRLGKVGISHSAIITGDNEAAAVDVAKQLNIIDVYPECLPVDKLTAIESVDYEPVVFVGDGVNDAPVLTAADVGIALGARGSTAASEPADVVILSEDVTHVAEGAEVAQWTSFVAKQTVLGGILASIGLMAIYSTGKLNPLSGAIAQGFINVFVISSALRAHSAPQTKRKKLIRLTLRRSAPKL